MNLGTSVKLRSLQQRSASGLTDSRISDLPSNYDAANQSSQMIAAHQSSVSGKVEQAISSTSGINILNQRGFERHNKTRPNAVSGMSQIKVEPSLSRKSIMSDNKQEIVTCPANLLDQPNSPFVPGGLPNRTGLASKDPNILQVPHSSTL